MGNSVTIPDLELEEMEAWRVFQHHNLANNRLREEWKEAVLRLGEARRAGQSLELCKTSSY